MEHGPEQSVVSDPALGRRFEKAIPRAPPSLTPSVVQELPEPMHCSEQV